MKCSIAFASDSHNTYNSWENSLDIEIGTEYTRIQFSDSDRVIQVRNDELKKILTLLNLEQP